MSDVVEYVNKEFANRLFEKILLKIEWLKNVTNAEIIDEEKNVIWKIGEIKAIIKRGSEKGTLTREISVTIFDKYVGGLLVAQLDAIKEKIKSVFYEQQVLNYHKTNPEIIEYLEHTPRVRLKNDAITNRVKEIYEQFKTQKYYVYYFKDGFWRFKNLLILSFYINLDGKMQIRFKHITKNKYSTLDSDSFCEKNEKNEKNEESFIEIFERLLLKDKSLFLEFFNLVV